MSSQSRSRSRSPSGTRSPSQKPAMEEHKTSRRDQAVSEDEGEASESRTPDSLGSGAMSVSESERSASAPPEDEGALYPLDGRFMSEVDKEEIMGLPEIRREEILAERAQQMEEQRISLKLRQRAQAQEKEDAKAAERQKRKAAAVELDESPRKASRPKTKAGEALEQLRKSRADKAERSKEVETESKSKTDQLFDNDNEEDSEVEFDEGTPKAATPSADPAPSERDFANVLVGRTNFADICYTPGCEDAIIGCFIRICIGPDPKQPGRLIYRLHQIKGVSAGKAYALEGRSGRPLYTDLLAVTAGYGKGDRKWEMKACSDKTFTREEFEDYRRAVLDSGKRLPTLSFLRGKLEALRTLRKHVWTDAEITYKLKRSAELQNPSSNRPKLLEERQKAEEKGNEAEIARIDKQLAGMDKSRPTAQPSLPSKPPALTQQDRLAKINLANRKANIENIRRAQIEEKRQAQAIMRGEGKANRLERVRTVAKTFHDAKPSKGAQSVDELFGDPSDASRIGTPDLSRAGTPTTAQLTNGSKNKNKKQTDDEVMAALDFEIDVQI